MKQIGGQAVIEGVMMKSGKGWTVAVRDPRGEVHVKREPLNEPPRLWRLPVMRGITALYYALSLGIRALEFSAQKAYDEGEEKPMKRVTLALTIVVGVLMGIGLFILLPLYATKLIGLVLPSVARKSLQFNLVDGVIRVGVFLLYVFLMGLWGEMRRIFEYHGAEHKVIHAYEAGRKLLVEDIKDMSPLHPRCGTSFLLIVMLTSIVVFSVIPQSWVFLYKFLARIVLIPAIAGLSYEALRLSAKIKDNTLANLLVLPGLLLQRLTTREPDDSQIQVAITALSEVLALEGEEAGAR